MKKTVSLILVLVLIAAFGAVAQDKNAETATNVKWFDPANCDFCKNLIEDPHLMENMTHEFHDISNGCVSITTVKPEYREAYNKAMDAMMKLAKEMEDGTRNPMDVKMDGSCQAYGMLQMAGAKTEYVLSDNADVMVMTSDNPETVKKIHEYAERNRAELAIWRAEQVAKGAKK